MIIVFASIFSTFLLSDSQNKKADRKRKQEIYRTIYEDPNRFYDARKVENPEGLINMMKSLKEQSESTDRNKNLPLTTTVYADYWNIKIISSLLQNGLLRELDIETIREISGSYSSHQTSNYFSITSVSFILQRSLVIARKILPNFINPKRTETKICHNTWIN